jgi:hypothetical protein
MEVNSVDRNVLSSIVLFKAAAVVYIVLILAFPESKFSSTGALAWGLRSLEPGSACSLGDRVRRAEKGRLDRLNHMARLNKAEPSPSIVKIGGVNVG